MTSHGQDTRAQKKAKVFFSARPAPGMSPAKIPSSNLSMPRGFLAKASSHTVRAEYPGRDLTEEKVFLFLNYQEHPVANHDHSATMRFFTI